jgi:chromosome segregation protein
VAAAEEQYWAAEQAGRQAATDWEAARETVIRAESRHGALVERDIDLKAEGERTARELGDMTERAGTDAQPATSLSAGADAASTAREEAEAAEARWRAAADAARTAADEVLAAEGALTALRLREADRLADAGRWAEVSAAASVRRDTIERDRAAVDARLAAAVTITEQSVRARSEAADTLSRAEADAARTAERRASAEDASRRAAVAVVEIDERRSRVAAELAEIKAASPAGKGDLVERLRTGGWVAPEALGAVPAEAGIAVAAVLGDVERALTWKPGADALIADSAGEARLLAAANGRPEGRTDALGAVGATQTLAELIDGASAPEVLHRTAVAPDLAALLAGWHRLPDGWAAVTLAGDLADARGVVTVRGRAGGAPAQGRGARLAALSELAERLDGEAEQARRDQSSASADHDRAMIAADAAFAALEAARVSRRRADEDGAGAESSHAHLVAERDRLAAAIAALPAVDRAPDQPTDLATELTSLAAAADAAREHRDAADAARDAAREAWQAAVQIADERDAAAGDRRASAARFAERGEQLERTLARIASERALLADAVHEAAASLSVATAAETAAADARTGGEQGREAARQALLEAERGLGGGSGRVAELEAAQQQVVADVSRLEEALAGLERERELALEGLPEADTDEASEAADQAEDAAANEAEPSTMAEEELDEEMRRTRRTLHQIGSVNPFAIEEHRELSTRLGELSVQETDLSEATESTQTLIARLDEEIAQQFQTAFAAIGEKFDEYCRLLFAGGSASLELTHEADDEAQAGIEAPGGIEIAVRPPGKRLQRLAMLSGGERALAGVALLFAMLTVNPVPFCVLDEVDAALDEANIGRFAEALRRLAETIDFVVITHNRATIETADTIYGVTMTDAAVSRVLSLRLADLPVEVPA